MTSKTEGTGKAGISVDSSGGINRMFFAGGSSAPSVSEYVPCYYAQVRIDFNDVRTGCRARVDLARAMEIFPGQTDFACVEDMMIPVDPGTVSSVLPEGARLRELPAGIDAGAVSRMETQFIEYLLRSFSIRIYRNSVLNAYSHSGESQADFFVRCMEMFYVPMRRELDALRDMFNRRLEQLKEKYMAERAPEGLEQARLESQNRDIFSHSSERITGWFLRGDIPSDPAPDSPIWAPGAQELVERLSGMESEAWHAVAELREAYEERARSMDEYRLHPNLKDIQFLRSGILWRPLPEPTTQREPQPTTQREPKPRKKPKAGPPPAPEKAD